MKIRTGMPEIGVQGRTINKDEACGRKDMVITGAAIKSGKYGKFVSLKIGDDENFPVPDSSFDQFADYVNDDEAYRDLISGRYVVVTEKVQGKENEYYISGLELASKLKDHKNS